MVRLQKKQPLTAKAHSYWQSWLQPGQSVLDATAGNGHDTLALAKIVGNKGRVIAVDIQPSAAQTTLRRLADAGYEDTVSVYCNTHHQPANFLPNSLLGKLSLVVFNLGYLPGGDVNLTTQAGTTMEALHYLQPWLAPNHMLSVITYPGHPQGYDEHRAFQGWLTRNAPRYQAVWQHIPPAKFALPPVLTILLAGPLAHRLEERDSRRARNI